MEYRMDTSMKMTGLKRNIFYIPVDAIVFYGVELYIYFVMDVYLELYFKNIYISCFVGILLYKTLLGYLKSFGPL